MSIDFKSHSCPFPGCARQIREFMCGDHWSLIPSLERRAIMDEFRAMKAIGRRKPTARLQEAFDLALRAVRRNLEQLIAAGAA